MADRAEDSQADALRAFTVLCSMRPDWRGALILASGLGRGGSALSLAANIAGAGCLAIDRRPEAGRAALRSGACDFVVNTVDEALRVLKNEIRQRRPVSVGLTAGSAAALDELLDRGVLPEMFTAFRSDGSVDDTAAMDAAMEDSAARRFAALGTAIMDFDESFPASTGAIHASARLDSFTLVNGLHFESYAFASAEELRAFDVNLLAIVPIADARHRWCAAAPRFFHRERPHRRAVFLSEEENKALQTLNPDLHR